MANDGPTPPLARSAGNEVASRLGIHCKAPHLRRGLHWQKEHVAVVRDPSAPGVRRPPGRVLRVGGHGESRFFPVKETPLHAQLAGAQTAFPPATAIVYLRKWDLRLELDVISPAVVKVRIEDGHIPASGRVGRDSRQIDFPPTRP